MSPYVASSVDQSQRAATGATEPVETPARRPGREATRCHRAKCTTTPERSSAGFGKCGSSPRAPATSSRATATSRTHLRSAGTTYQGAHFVEVFVSASSYAVMKVPQSFRDSRSPEAELPALLGVVEPRLQADPLLLGGDVQEDLDQRRPLVGERALELPDVPVAAAPDRLGSELAHAHGHDVLVVRSVEDPDLAALRQHLVDAPQVVVGELDRGRRLERGDPDALWVQAREHLPDRPVLPRRVHSLEDEQHATAGLCPETVVQRPELVDERLDDAGRLGLVAEAQPVRGIPMGEPGRAARLDDQLLDHGAPTSISAKRQRSTAAFSGISLVPSAVRV